MGGGAFLQAYAQGEPTLHTPRMSPEDYQRLKAKYLEKLQVLFPGSKVAALTEAPEKTDYGDIDIFIATERTVDLAELGSAIGAAGVICRSGKTATLGVHKDGTEKEGPAVVYKVKNGQISSSEITTEEYAQIDIGILSPEMLEWHTFYSSYGDMIGLLGHIVTQLGFTVSDRGFWLRLQELDFSKTVEYVSIADHDGKIFLSSDPKLVIDFLGCSLEAYDAGFSTLDGLYEWLGACRLLSADALKINRTRPHERNREQRRPVYSRFFYEWLPVHMDMATTEDETERKQKVSELRVKYLSEAIDYFHKEEEYGTRHQALTLAISQGYAVSLLKPIIGEHSGRMDKSLTEILRAFRRHVVFGEDGKPHVTQDGHTDAESELHKFLTADGTALEDTEAASVWVRDNWEGLKELQRLRGKVGNFPSA